MASASQTQRKSKSGHLVVAAISIGSAYSNYAYSDGYERDPPKVYVPYWSAGRLLTLKTPSVLLLSPDKTFRSFGYQAEDEYANLVEDGEHNDYYYFRSFSALFDSQRLTPDMLIGDSTGKKLRAILVSSLSINYLKSRLLIELRMKTCGIEETDIMLVLTVPANWNAEKKQFMRKAAQEAGIMTENLLIALEPEAASLFCMHIPIDHDNLSGSSTNISPFQPGNKYMVVDAGACYVHITVYQVVDSGKLREMYLYNSEMSGGRLVDEAFKRFLIRLVGKTVYAKIEMEWIEDLTELYREFEITKRTVNPDIEGRKNLKIPYIFVDTYWEVEQKRLRDEVGEKFDHKVTIACDKLRIDASLVRSWFDEPIKKIVQQVQKLLQYQTCKDVSAILLVGGFSESPMLQDAMRKEFQHKRFIIPEYSDMAVLKGAVIFGHNPVTVLPRVAECSYGVLDYRNFQNGIHPVSKKTNVAGKIKCKDVFATMFKKGQQLVEGKAIFYHRYTPLEANQTTLIFDIYKSLDEEPKFVTDPGCMYVGRLEVEVPDLSGGKERGVWVQMIHTDNELIFEARDEKTGKIAILSVQD